MQASYLHPPFLTPAGVKDRPYQAQYEHITLRKLPGGKASRHVKTGVSYRAADGRSRREEYSEGASGRAVSVIIIHDPLNQAGYLLDAEAKTFFRMPLSNIAEQPSNTASELQSESLAFNGDYIGERVVEGLACRGYRSNPQGEGIFEYWVSEELSEVILAKSVLENEESALRIFNINRVEPDDELFTVPPNYTPMAVETD